MHEAISMVMSGFLFSACMASGTASYSVTTPRRLYVIAGVQVIGDDDEPMFYSSDRYGRSAGGVWSSSRDHTRDWVRIATPPPAIVRIDRPAAYIHVKGNARVAPKVGQRAPQKDERRDDRAEQKAGVLDLAGVAAACDVCDQVRRRIRRRAPTRAAVRPTSLRPARRGAGSPRSSLVDRRSGLVAAGRRAQLVLLARAPALHAAGR